MKDARHWGWDLVLALMWLWAAWRPPHTHFYVDAFEVIVSALYFSRVIVKLTRKRQQVKS